MKNQVAISLLVVGLIFFSIPAGMQAYAQDALPQPSQQQILDSTSGPIFLNAYWTDGSASSDTSPPRKEAGPGDGASTLAVVLVNRGNSAITAVKGSLSLPPGFTANSITSSSQTAVATYDNVVSGGQTFVLYFDIYIGKAQVGSYSASLQIQFSRLIETGSFRSTDISVPFRLTGKVVLDPVPITRNLVPGVTNDVNIEIRNSGSADASGVTVSITGISASGGSRNVGTSDTGQPVQGQITNFGARTFNLGTISANSSATFISKIFPNISTGGATAGVQLEIMYSDAYGTDRTLNPTVGLVVLQSAPSIIGVKGVSAANENENRIIAGRNDNFVLEIANKGTVPITNAVITIESTTTSMNILGDAKWAVDRIEAGSSARLETRVFATTSLIGSPATFHVTVDYLIDGAPKTEEYVLGTYVDGEIALRVYGMSISYVGAQPTLIGNILNEGNTAALFTTLELQQSQSNTLGQQAGGNLTRAGEGASAPQQYLGDLTSNSPLPFSIPLLLPRGTEPGPIPVTIKITYKDNLRATHEFVTSDNVVLPPQQAAGPQTRNAQQNGGMPVLLIALFVVATGGAGYFFWRRRRKAVAPQSPKSQQNIEDILSNPGREPEKK